MNKNSLALFILAFGIIINSCNDPTPLGSELLAEDQVDVLYTDTIKLSASTVREDVILAYDPNPSITYDNFQFGDFTDPIFGNAVASIYAQLIPDFDPPNYTNAILDSIILTLQYDSLRTYGILDAVPFGIGIYRITDNIDIESKYYSDQVFSFDEAMPLAEISSFTPAIASQDSITGIIDYSFDADGETISIPAGLRIPLSLSLGEELINYDSITYTSNNNFLEQFNGIHVKPLTQTPGMLSFDITSFSSSNLTVYYRRDTIKTQYEYNFSDRFVQFNNFSHDTAGAIVDDFFDDTTKGDSLLFIQAMAGSNVKIDFQDFDDFQNVIINKAELIFTVAELDEDDPENYPPTRALIGADIGTDGEFVFLSDLLLGPTSFGGIVTEVIGDEGEILQQYTMNISAHFQDIVDGNEDRSIYLRAFPKQEKSDRVIIYGPGHSKYPMKLKLTYTKLK